MLPNGSAWDIIIWVNDYKYYIISDQGQIFTFIQYLFNKHLSNYCVPGLTWAWLWEFTLWNNHSLLLPGSSQPMKKTDVQRDSYYSGRWVSLWAIPRVCCSKEGPTSSVGVDKKGFPRGAKVLKMKRSQQGREREEQSMERWQQDHRCGCEKEGSMFREPYLPFCRVLVSAI